MKILANVYIKLFVIQTTEVFIVKNNLKVSCFNANPSRPAYVKIYFKIIRAKIIVQTAL